MGIKEDYLKNGFVHLKEVFSAEEVKIIREKINSNGSGSYVKDISDLLRDSEIYSVQFNRKIVGAVKEIFGNDALVLNDVNIHVNQFYNNRPDKGWHLDADGERLARYLFSSDYGFCKIGVYLKDNTESGGGGIDVEFGGHKSFCDFGSSRIGYALSVAYYFLGRTIFSIFRAKKRVESCAGDVIIFDSRLPHRSTPSNFPNKEISKITIYWQVAKDELNARRYLIHSMHMASADPNNYYHYSDFLSYHYPDDYPSEYVALASNSGLRVSSLSSGACKRYAVNVGSGPFADSFFTEGQI